ncbi:MAG: substrate-binding domain-containing protein [Bacteroidales bacterium]|nr:substrate-binding domain-containing protein [Bacteroidales bacterium]MCF8336650.1 substrate-binding domain-containing protein [Bacteroidales bacterium]
MIQREITTVVIFVLLLTALKAQGNEKYTIGFSQCTMIDIWREEMVREMRTEIGIRPDLDLIMKDAHDDSKKQIQDIHELVEADIDLLIVSPNESEPLTPVVSKVYKSGIPVILIDRKINSEDYTAFIGADNFQVGSEAGSYIAKLLEGEGRILEIWGLYGSSPAKERHKGLLSVLANHPEIEIAHSETGKWLWSRGKKVMKEQLDSGHQFDLVFAHNDFMAHGAYLAAKEKGVENDYYFVGVDGLSGPEGGVQHVLEGRLDATVLYPTGGYKAIQVASKILNNKEYKRENILNTVLIDSTNARIIKTQTETVQSLQTKIQKHRDIFDQQMERFKSQRFLLTISVFFLVLVISLTILLFRSYRTKMKVNKKLQKQKDEIEKRNNEITNQQQELIKVNKELENATQMKLRFFTNISHELRTPLTLILGPLEKVIKEDKYSRDDLKMFKMMHRNATRMIRLINELMDFRKLESNRLKLHAAKHDLVSFMSQIKNSFEELAIQKNIEFNLENEVERLELYFDKHQMDKVMFNLLSNAFKHTPEHGRITITLSEGELDFDKTRKEGVQVKVTDNGKGMSKEHVNYVFKRFYNIDQQKTEAHFPGTGIGLSLTKGLVALHKGIIKVDSRKGEGTSVIMNFPKGKEHLNEEELVQEEIEEKEPKHFIPEEALYTPEIMVNESAGQKQEQYFETFMVLVVEDNKDVREYIGDSLGEAYTIIEAANGREGLEKLRDEGPDLVIADIMMPEMDGLEMTKALKSDIRTCHVPVILLTALSSLENKLEGIEYGADSYIPKPFNSKHLEVRARKLIENRQTIRRHYQDDVNFDPDDSNDLNQLDKRFLNNAINLVEKNINNEALSVEILSQKLGLSRVHLYRKVKHLTGMTVSEFIRSTKLKKAAQMIRTSGLTFSEIAYETGFSSPSYFTKCFKDHFNISPKEYSASSKK